MVRTVIAACFVLLLALPALAQEDYPKIQTSMGYANLSFPDFTTGNSSRHSGGYQYLTSHSFMLNPRSLAVSLSGFLHYHFTIF